MANITINSNVMRVQYTASSGQTEFTFAFPIVANSDLKVYQRAASASADDVDDLLTLTTDYTVSGAGTANGGTVTLVSGATLNDVVTIVGQKPIDRSAIYQQGVVLKRDDLNTDFNNNVIFEKQNEMQLNEVTPRYNYSEGVSSTSRQGNLRLPILNDNDIWIGRGNSGDLLDDIEAVNLDSVLDQFGSNAKYIVQTANEHLPNAQSLGALTTGIMLNTVTAGVGVVSTLTSTGTGAVVRADSPALTTPNLGVPSAIDLTNATGLPTAGLADGSVTYAKIQNVSATDKVLGRATAGAGIVEEIDCTAAGRALLDDADNVAQRTTLGLGTLATQNANAVAITGGSITGITDLAVADGGTGVSTLAAGGLLVGNSASAIGVVAAGATTEILVGGGVSTAPVWTAATGTGAPVRGTAPTITTNITTNGVATTAVAPNTYIATVPDTNGNRAGYRVQIAGGGPLGGLAVEQIAGGAYPNSIGRTDIYVQNGVSTITAISAAASGDVTFVRNTLQPSMPAFSAYNSANDFNVTGAGTVFNVLFDTEIFDRGADFASSTFTAPVTGIYQLNVSVGSFGITAAADTIRLDLVTSNRTYSAFYSKTNSLGDNQGFQMSVLADMDASDTAIINFTVTGEAGDVVDVNGAAVSPVLTFFNGYLVG